MSGAQHGKAGAGSEQSTMPAAAASASAAGQGAARAAGAAGAGLENAQVVIFGMGLLGGSLARALKARGQSGRLTALVRHPEPGEAALRAGAVDHYLPLPEGTAPSEELVRVLRDADLAVLCTPVSAMEALVKACAPFLKRGCVLTDVGSVKAPQAKTLPGLLPEGVCYVGAHPMAGGHLGGFAQARADLFEGAVCVVTPPDAAGAPGAAVPPQAVQRVEALFRALGARVLLRTPEAHDAQVAWISHAPHAVAYAFSAAQQQAPGPAAALRGPGFRDFTRIAGSDPELWADLLLANRARLRRPLGVTIKALESLLSALKAGDRRALLEQFAAARAALHAPSQEAGHAAGRPAHAKPQGEQGSARPGSRGAQESPAPTTGGTGTEQQAEAALAASRSHSN